jgi:hypothetical protein
MTNIRITTVWISTVQIITAVWISTVQIITAVWISTVQVKTVWNDTFKMTF